MAYTTGTCTGHIALLDALKTFLEAQGWTTKRYTTGDVYEYIAMGPGLTGTDEIYVGVQTYTNVTTPCYNWKLRGYTGYSSLLDFSSQPGAMSQPNSAYGPGLLLTNGTIQYWFVCDGRRVIVIAKCGTSYDCAYLGLLNPYGPSSQFSYPLYIGGNTCQTTLNYLDTSSWNRDSFFYPRIGDSNYSPSCVLLCGNVWQAVVNYVATDNKKIYKYTLHVFPYPLNYTDNRTMSYLRENLDGSYPLIPAIIHSGIYNSTKAIYGELSGVYALPRWDNLPEDTITIDSVSYVVVQRSHLTDNSSLAAIKLA
mgnify:CR=1 FL=1